MKTITIPTRFGYPTLDLFINGKKYTFNSGVEISVEDYVADVIENAIALEPKVGRNKSRFAQYVEGGITEISESDLEGIDTIAAYAFSQCFSLTRVKIPNNITKIAKSAFTICTGLKSVIFGDDSKLNTIEENAFVWCTSLVSVYLPPKPPTLANVNAFADIGKACIFYCKTQASLDAYKAATNWSALTETYTFKVEE